MPCYNYVPSFHWFYMPGLLVLHYKEENGDHHACYRQRYATFYEVSSQSPSQITFSHHSASGLAHQSCIPYHFRAFGYRNLEAHMAQCGCGDGEDDTPLDRDEHYQAYVMDAENDSKYPRRAGSLQMKPDHTHQVGLYIWVI